MIYNAANLDNPKKMAASDKLTFISNAAKLRGGAW